MGSSQSTDGGGGAANVTPVTTKRDTDSKNASGGPHDDDASEVPKRGSTRALETPILMEDDDHEGGGGGGKCSYPKPTGREYDLMDKLAAELPNVIDEESRQQVEDYIQACDNGKGPMVACFSSAEYLSLFLRKHKDAEELYQNTCFRPKNDKSANGVEVDGTKAYPPACFNLAQMRMTGKGNTKFSRKEGYELFDRACRAGHGGSCHMQAKMLSSYPGAMGPGVPYDPSKAAKLLEGVCEEGGDSLSCFTLASMLLRGDAVSAEADNVTPDEAQGVAKVKRRENEDNRTKETDDARKALKRDPPRAAELLQRGCERGHAPSCYNMAVMFTQGDEGVPKDTEKAKEYQKKTEELVERFGGFGFGGSMG